MNQLLLTLTYAAALGSGLIAGVFFAFSTFIMGAFGRVGGEQGVAAMQSINTAILRSLFMPVFFGTALIGLGLGAAALWRGGTPGGTLLIIAGLVYLVGVIGITIVFNVPLNEALDRVPADSAEAAALWARYLRVWTTWNHVRAVASAVSCVLYMITIASR